MALHWTGGKLCLLQDGSLRDMRFSDPNWISTWTNLQANGLTGALHVQHIGGDI